MSVLSWLFALSAAAYFLLGVWVIARQQGKVQALYGLLCLTTCFWQGIWAILFSHVLVTTSYLWLKICYTAIVFVPAVFYHLF